MSETTRESLGFESLAVEDEAAGPSRLPFSLIFIYSAPRIAFGLMGMLFSIYLMKYSTDVLLIAPATMGVVFFVARLWDGVSDPMAGYLSDRTKSRFGRRRSWMFASALPLGFSMFMLWSPPSALVGTMLVLWMGFAIILYETASTAYFVPHGALAVELTQDYHDRTRLFGLSHIIGFIGTGIGIITLWLLTNAEDQRSFAFNLSLVSGVLVSAIVLWSTYKLPEREEYQQRGAQKIWKSYGDVFRNPHARLLLIVYGIESFGSASLAMLFPYLFQYIIKAPGHMPILMGVFFGLQVVFTPLWIRLSRHFGKKQLWIFAMTLTVCGHMGYFFMDEGTLFRAYFWAAVVAFAGSCSAIVAPSIQADVIDYDEYVTHERKEGTYLAAWNFVRKCAGAVTAMVTGFVLQFGGFEPNAEQTEQVKFAMLALLGLAPAASHLIGLLLFLRFSFNQREHDEVLREIRAR